MSAVEAVLFDFSATLFDPARVVDGDALARQARRRGGELDEPAAQSLASRILAHADTPEGLATRTGCDLSPERHREGWVRLAAAVPGVSGVIAEAFYDCITDPARWRPYTDTEPTLAGLRQRGVRVAVVSNCGWDLRAAFTLHGLGGLVDEYVLSCEHGREKPDPELFRHACERLGVAPAATVMIGDDPRTDTGALRAGIAVYLLAPPQPFPAPRGLGRILSL